MNPILYVTSNIDNAYNEFGFSSRIKDKLKTKIITNEYIKELDIKLINVRMPPNFNKRAYYNNVNYAKKISKCGEVQLSLKTLRTMDYKYYNQFQKRFLAFSVIKSVQLMLRVRKKSLKNCCIVVYDACDMINNNIIEELAKYSKYIVLLSSDLVKVRKLSDYIIASYGVSPIVTNDEIYATKIADFIISSKNHEFGCGNLVWFLDNSMNKQQNIIAVNDVSYNVPWNINETDLSIELVGAILCQMQENDIEKALKYNDIHLKEIKFNNNVIG
ncbi:MULTISPECIES: hypothetical protein [Clostridium]|uniref:Uncharacterized protein n=1 Tax=Clostridium frigoriphilum TaxID=443253 RepID=A0ABU7UT45_9CLOT|nr:hypothetical protein [Clostridium sp. DSM 17811]MBU3101021.1 hypothetical protein [Clostridium sp. DSM 17811]